jgi:ribosome-associated protein
VTTIPIDSDSQITAQQIADILDAKQAEHITLLDVSELIQITEAFVIATGNSRRQVMTLADELAVQMKTQDQPPLRIEGQEEGTWLLVDFGDVVVHLFQDEPRRHYDLERLWGDAPRLEWEPATVGEG